MSNCEFDDLIPAYLSKALSWRQRWEVWNHLRRCSRCQAALEEWQAVGLAVQELHDETPPPSPGLKKEVFSRVRSKPKPPLLWPRLAHGFLTLLLAVMCLQLWRQIDDLLQPRAVIWARLDTSRAQVEVIEVGPDDPFFGLEVDINDTRRFAQFLCEFRNQDGSAMFSIWMPADYTLRLNMPTGRFEMGSSASLVIKGQLDQESFLVDVAEYRFLLEPKKE